MAEISPKKRVSKWTKLVRANDVPPSAAKFVAVGDMELAIFRLENPDRFVVTRNSCPHAGGNLAAGKIEGARVTCPWHQWQFDLDSGACTFNETVTLRSYDCKVVEGFVYAHLTGS